MNLSQISELLAQKGGMSKANAEKFVKSYFDIITNTTVAGDNVKIKGFGTFKIVMVEDRESIRVNTGERFLIPGYKKVNFLPDAELKEEINKPFSAFETLILTDSQVEAYTHLEESPESVESNGETQHKGELTQIDEFQQPCEPKPSVETFQHFKEAQDDSSFHQVVEEPLQTKESLKDDITEQSVASRQDIIPDELPEPQQDNISVQTTEPQQEIITGRQSIEPEHENISEQTTDSQQEIISEQTTDSQQEDSSEQTSEPKQLDSLHDQPGESMQVAEPVQEQNIIPDVPKVREITQKRGARIALKLLLWILALILVLFVLAYMLWPLTGRKLLAIYDSNNSRIEVVDHKNEGRAVDGVNNDSAENDNTTLIVTEGQDDTSPQVVEPVEVVEPEKVEQPVPLEGSKSTTEQVEQPVKSVQEQPAEPARVVEPSPAYQPSTEPVKVEEKVSAQQSPVKPQPTEPTVNQSSAFHLIASDENKDLSFFTAADTVNYRMTGTLKTHQVRGGETLTQISLAEYGTKKLWPYIAAYNKMKNFNSLNAGSRILIPKLEAR